MAFLANFIYRRLLGWELYGSLPDLPKYVIIIGPHTSWHDFVIGLLVRAIVKDKINFIGKKSLFNPPFGWYFRWLGGSPVDRGKSSNVVHQMTRKFNESKEFRLALSPEGTRKKVSSWKTGFYYIARASKVPVVMVALDFGNKRVLISEARYTTGDMDADMNTFRQFFTGVRGKVAEYGFE